MLNDKLKEYSEIFSKSLKYDDKEEVEVIHIGT
jgi:hypothetical protein